MNNVVFQAFSWTVDDDTDDNADYENMQFTVHVCGRTMDGDSVALHVKGFYPSFCIEFPEWLSNESDYDDFVEFLGDKYLVQWSKQGSRFVKDAEWKDHIIELEGDDSVREDEKKILHKKSLWGFDFSKKKRFFQLSFRSLRAYRKILGLLRACHTSSMSIPTMNEYIGDMKEADYNARDLVTSGWADRENLDERVLRYVWKLSQADLPLAFAKGKLFEVVDPILRFAHKRNLSMAGWLEARGTTECDAKKTTCQIELETDYNNLFPVESDKICPHIKEMAFDIEAYSHDGRFPDPLEKENIAYQIGITVKKYSDRGFDRILLHCVTPASLRETENSGRVESIPPVDWCLCSGKLLSDCYQCAHEIFSVKTRVENYETEPELLLAFARLIVSEDVDLIYGYNSDSFDWNYVMTRASVVGCQEEFFHMSRFRDYKCKVEEKSFNSSAMGSNEYLRVDIPGRLNIDLMVWIKRNMPQDRYPSYKLDDIAEKEISEKKREVPVKEIFAAYRSGNSERLERVGDYCCHDGALVQKLVGKLDVVTQTFEMANITDTPSMYLMQKGQQIKCYSQITKEAREQGFLTPLADERQDGKFQGAIVLEPKKGWYNTPVSVLDFASLYPSIQMAYNICYSTIVLNPALMARIQEARAQCHGGSVQLDGVEFHVKEWEDDVMAHVDSDGNEQEYTNLDDAKSKDHPKKEIIASLETGDGNWIKRKRKHVFAFAQNQPSVIPTIQRKLKQSRKAVRRLMAPIEDSQSFEDQLRYRVLNGRQLAIKVSMNSLYGFTSAFMLNLTALAAVVTATGREMIEQTKHFMENDFSTIAIRERWTEKDTLTYFDINKKEVIVQRHETVPTSYVKKFPVAKADALWVELDRKDLLGIDIVGGDTDSVFANFPNSSINEAISLCHKASEILTRDVFGRAPIEMEYEKTYLPMIIQKKKNYIGVKYEMDERRWKMDYKGIAIKRRNYCEVVKKTFWDVIYPAVGMSLQTDSVTGAVRYEKTEWNEEMRGSMALSALNKNLRRLVFDDIPYEDLTISASLQSDYKGKPCPNCDTIRSSGKKRKIEQCNTFCNTCLGRGLIVNLPHVQLADRMRIRDEGSAPRPGNRFGYIVVDDPYRKNDLSARTEDPAWAKDHGLQPDRSFYLEQQVKKPLVKFLTLLGKQAEVEAAFERASIELAEKARMQRFELNISTQKTFFSGGVVQPVTPLKPKKVNKAARTKKALQGVADVRSFFGKTDSL